MGWKMKRAGKFWPPQEDTEGKKGWEQEAEALCRRPKLSSCRERATFELGSNEGHISLWLGLSCLAEMMLSRVSLRVHSMCLLFFSSLWLNSQQKQLKHLCWLTVWGDKVHQGGEGMGAWTQGSRSLSVHSQEVEGDVSWSSLACLTSSPLFSLSLHSWDGAVHVMVGLLSSFKLLWKCHHRYTHRFIF